MIDLTTKDIITGNAPEIVILDLKKTEMINIHTHLLFNKDVNVKQFVNSGVLGNFNLKEGNCFINSQATGGNMYNKDVVLLKREVEMKDSIIKTQEELIQTQRILTEALTIIKKQNKLINSFKINAKTAKTNKN
jgi:hypothetical protein